MIFKKKKYENKIKNLECKINENENTINQLISKNMKLLKEIDLLKAKFITLPNDEKILRILLYRVYNNYDCDDKKYKIILDLKYNKKIVIDCDDKKDMKEKYDKIIKQI